jgi:hypothetical protein
MFERRSGKRHPDNKYCEPPTAGLIWWKWFWDLSSGRSQGKPISFSELDSWARLKSVELEPEDIQAIKTMDAAFLAALRAENDRPRNA